MMLRNTFFLFSFMIAAIACGQEILTKTQAMTILMEQNFNIRLADLNVEIAENNTSLLNSGYLPTISANGNINYNVDNSELQFASGQDTTINNAESNARGLSLNANYVLFNGFNRKYSISRNRENLSATQLNAQATLESTLIELYTVYYSVAQSQQTLGSLRETLDISKDRLKRTQYGFDFGRNTRLDVSNAEVDVNNDSINYLNAKQNLENQIRNLNLILALESDDITYRVDTAVSFQNLQDKQSLMESLLQQNTQIQLARAGISISEYDSRISQRNYYPTINLNGGYSTNLNNFAPGNFLASRRGSGVTYGASFTWNLFDGGSSQVAMQNARVNVGVQRTLFEQAKKQTVLNFENAWSNYKNLLFVVRARANNLKANQQNFERSEEKYRLGQITSLEFRTAQSNLLQAEIDLINARYNAKIAELTIYQLSGQIQRAAF